MNLLTWLLNNAVNIVVIGVLIWVGFLLYPRARDYIRRHRPVKNPLDNSSYPPRKIREVKEDNTPTPSNELEVKDSLEKEGAGSGEK